MRLQKILSLLVGIGMVSCAGVAQAQVGSLADDVYAALVKGQNVRVSVTGIEYRFLSKEPKKANVQVVFSLLGKDQNTITRAVDIAPGQRVIDALFFCDGHTEDQEASFLFYRSNTGLDSKFASLTSSTEQFNASGLLTQSLLDGFWKNDPKVKVTLSRDSFVYNVSGKADSYMSRYTIFTGVSGFPGGQIDALKINRIIYGTNNLPRHILYGHFYGPSTKTFMYNIRYNDAGEVMGYSMSLSK